MRILTLILLSILGPSAPAFVCAQVFTHGVASGDPRPESVVIWTRVQCSAPAEVTWMMGPDSTFMTRQKVYTGSVYALPEHDGCVSILVKGLQPGQTYFYRFAVQEEYSITGRTRTAPAAECRQLRFAVVSCANFEAGYYNAYARIADRNDLDAVIHLGDYIYEYGAGVYGNKKIGRLHQPPHELLALEDYRMRYAQYRADPELQRLHARHPMISIWDDHEFANNSYVGGAQNHQEQEGNWEDRKAAARQAYFEWMPVTPHPLGIIRRSFSFGGLVDLWMLDERMEARTRQVDNAHDPGLNDSLRYMIGPDQMSWLCSSMERSNATWRMIGNQVILSSIDASRVFPDNPKFTDMWDGYPADRKRLFDCMSQAGINNVVVVTGDSHTSWIMDLVEHPADEATWDRETGRGIYGVEFAGPSISSANYDEYVKRFIAKIGERRFTRRGLNPHVRWNNVTEHGFMIITFTPEKVEGDYYFVPTVRKKHNGVKHIRHFEYALPEQKDQTQIKEYPAQRESFMMGSAFVPDRTIEVWLPPGYDGNESSYPLLLAHDGQNVFDPGRTFDEREWRLDETLDSLIRVGAIPPVIAVGVWNDGVNRRREYLPELSGLPAVSTYTDSSFFEYLRSKGNEIVLAEGQDLFLGSEYMDFITLELLPELRRRYRISGNKEDIVTMGSSMGGQVSLYAICRHPDIFGTALCISTHWTIPGFDEEWLRALHQFLPDPKDHVIYFDYGTLHQDAGYEPMQLRVDELMRSLGYTEGMNWTTRKFPGDGHNEMSWSRRLPGILKFAFAR